jgi:hypothetical protein
VGSSRGAQLHNRGGQQDFVAKKIAEQVDLHTLHRVRERLMDQRTGIMNEIRAFLLERGVAWPCTVKSRVIDALGAQFYETFPCL